MGNSQWTYFVPYEDDIEQALRRLRKREFAECRYYKDLFYAEDEMPGSLAELVQRTTYRTHSILDVAKVELPVSEERLPDQDSLFPIPRVAATPTAKESRKRQYLDYPDVPEEIITRYGNTIFPVPRSRQREILGTEKPTIWVIAEALDACLLERIRQPFYLTVYEDHGRLEGNAVPEQIFFYGVSGGGP
jgi:hypothetical protein